MTLSARVCPILQCSSKEQSSPSTGHHEARKGLWAWLPGLHEIYCPVSRSKQGNEKGCTPRMLFLSSSGNIAGLQVLLDKVRRKHEPHCWQSAAPHCALQESDASPKPMQQHLGLNQKWAPRTLTSPCSTLSCPTATEKVGLLLPMPAASIDTNKTKMLLKLQVTSGNDTRLTYYGNQEKANSH